MQEFLIAPAAGRAMWLLMLVPGVVICLVAGLLGAAVISSRGARFEVSPAGLRLRGDLYGRLIPIEQLRAASASRVDFSTMPELRPARRTCWYRSARVSLRLVSIAERRECTLVSDRR